MITPKDLINSTNNGPDENIFTQQAFDEYLQYSNELRQFEEGLKKGGMGQNNQQDMNDEDYRRWQELQKKVTSNPFAKNRDKYHEFLTKKTTPHAEMANPITSQTGGGQGTPGELAKPAMPNGEVEYSESAMEEELRRQLYNRK